MCGIAALFSSKPLTLHRLIFDMNTMAKHRGPDDEGYTIFLGPDLRPELLGGDDTPSYVYGSDLAYAPTARVGLFHSDGDFVALAHRRLAIVDVSASGHQPMTDVGQRYWVVYNGEIYNHIELRAELEARGYQFVSKSDTEVIIHGYREWGEDCLTRFNGMFAFVLFDRVLRRVLIARDRFGIKPLYLWSGSDGLLAIASEIKQFSALPSWRARLNGQRAYEFLNWGLFDHTDETLFAGVRQLRGGEMIACSLDELLEKMPIKCWYRLPLVSMVESFSDAAQRVCTLLEDSVRLQLRADVLVGSCLSGGLDSSSIVCLANRLLRKANVDALQKTFSARSTDLQVDEGSYIEAVVQCTGTANFQVIPPLSQLFELLPLIAWHQDEPFGSTSIFAQWHVFQLAAQHGVRVMLDGQGADEQLAGYHVFHAARFGSLLRHLHLLTLVREISDVRQIHGTSTKQLLAYVFSSVLPEGVRQPLRRLLGRSSVAVPEWLDIRRLGATAVDPFDVAGSRASSVQELSRTQLLSTNLPMLLHWEDRDSMAHAIEARVPFLDHRLVELVLGLPDGFKICGATTKMVLREAMRGILPDAIRSRTDKIGFATAEEQWVRYEVPKAFRSSLEEAVQVSDGVLRQHALRVLDDIIDGRRAFSFLPWRMICFGAWMKRFDVQVDG